MHFLLVGRGALGTVLQTRLMDVSGEAQALPAALNHSAFNTANALGPLARRPCDLSRLRLDIDRLGRLRPGTGGICHLAAGSRRRQQKQSVPSAEPRTPDTALWKWSLAGSRRTPDRRPAITPRVAYDPTPARQRKLWLQRCNRRHGNARDTTHDPRRFQPSRGKQSACRIGRMGCREARCRNSFGPWRISLS